MTDEESLESLKKKKVKELQELCGLMQISFKSSATKSELIGLITNKTEEETPKKKRGRPAKKVSEEEKKQEAPAEPPKEPEEDIKNEAETEPETEQISETEESGKEKAADKPQKQYNYKEGILEVMPEGCGFLRIEGYYQSKNDWFVPSKIIKDFNLKTGDKIMGTCRPQKDLERPALSFVKEVNGIPPWEVKRRKSFETLVPIFPEEKYVLESNKEDLSTRIIDLIAPIGKGQRAMIVSPPKAGKTMLLQSVAGSIMEKYPDSELIVLLIDERPEEVTEMKRFVDTKGDVVASTFDEMPEKHVKVAELVQERAQRLVEQGKDVVILLDSITRLARAYNLTVPPTGRSLSGGIDPGALYKPKKFFGAARNLEFGGSLTIIATALVDTGSKMDDVIYEEFKGTGNMELHLDRSLYERRIFPAIDVTKSGTRREEKLLTEEELNVIYKIREEITRKDKIVGIKDLLEELKGTENNEQFISSRGKIFDVEEKIAFNQK